MERSQAAAILQDLQKKLVFLVGPRQVGKTWLARQLATRFSRSLYLNYDSIEDRRIIQRGDWLPETELLVLDELHKMPGWKNYLKGLYDTRPAHLKILVTGSARLDTFRRGGDSLAGRFFTHHLLPLAPAELAATGAGVDLARLTERGGFPEPFLAEDGTAAARWRLQYVDGLVRGDILDFERIHDLKGMQLLFELLRRRVGSPVSHASLARDIGIAPNTVKKYITILEALFIVFRVTPYVRNVARALLKEPKLYFFDTGLVKGDAGACFENLAALALVKHAWGRADCDGVPCELRYLRTKEGREVDFCLVEDGEAVLLLEAKLGDEAVSKTLAAFCTRLGVPGIQLVRDLKHERIAGPVRVLRAAGYLAGLRV